MTAAYNLGQIAQFDVRIDLRGGQPSVSQELLYLPDIGLAFEQMSGTRVPHRVRRDPLFYPGVLRPFSDDPPDVVGVERPARTRRNEQAYLPRSGRESGTRLFKIEL